MALAPFFERVYGALGGHLGVSRESLTGALGSVSVGIRCAAKLHENDWWIAELATNLCARLYPRLAISASERHRGQLAELARKINPEIEVTDQAPDDATICIGALRAEGALFPSATGWVARLDHQTRGGGGPANPYAAGAAASFACAELFRRIFLKSHSERDVSVSLLNFDRETGADGELGSRSVGEVLWAGIGAVGNAALWVLARDATVRGKLYLVDAEGVDLSNLQRYVLGTYADVTRPKVEVASDTLRATGLEFELAQVTLERFVDTANLNRIPTTVISVDNVLTRRAAQALLPRLIINGWTGEQALGASWHVFSREAACLACLYHPQGQGVSQIQQAANALGLPHDRAALLWVTRQPLSSTDIEMISHALGVKESVLRPWRQKSLGEIYTDVICGSVPLDVQGVGRIEAVPLAHQSALAGILMAAELVKRTDRELAALSQSEPLISWDNILQQPPAIWSKPRPRERGCICGDADYQTIFDRKWAGHFSTTPS